MLTALILAATFQTSPQATPPADLSWMAGYWLDCENGREVSETWSDPRQGLIVGFNVTIRNGRAGFESARIAPTPEGLAYIAQPEGQPPTTFLLAESGPGRAAFHNPGNDFPTRILYARDGDTLTARIEGEIDGRSRAVDWRFRRAELNARCAAGAS